MWWQCVGSSCVSCFLPFLCTGNTAHMYVFKCRALVREHTCLLTILPRRIGDNQVDGIFHQLYHHQLDACISLSLSTSYPRTFVKIKRGGRGIACCTELQIALYMHTYICPLTQHVISMCLVCVYVHIVHVHTTHALKCKFVFLLCKFNFFVYIPPLSPPSSPYPLVCS